VLEADVVELLESGCALVVGLVTASGLPLASRGWGLDLLESHERARVLVNARDVAALGHPEGGLVGRSIAVTGTHISSLRSIQVKGRVVAVEPPRPADAHRIDAYCDGYFGAVEETDNFPRALMERMRPLGVTAVTFGLEEMYDQTPGPNAGAAMIQGAR